MNIDTTSPTTIIASLTRIAKDFILHRALKINDKTYAIIDLEVYFWHPHHPDEYAKGVNHHREIGQLEAHKYGIDISLGNNPEKDFGGMLICGLYDYENNIIIEKARVQRTLLNSLHLFENHISFINYSHHWTDTFCSVRNNLGKANTPNKTAFIDAKYKFLAKDKSIFKGYKGKEAIFKKSDLSHEEIKKLLGYTLK